MKLLITYTLIVTSVWNEIIGATSELESLTRHVLQLEQMVSDIQSQAKTQEQKYAAVLQSVLSKLTTTTDELNALKEEHNSTLLEMKAVAAVTNKTLESLTHHGQQLEQNVTALQIQTKTGEQKSAAALQSLRNKLNMTIDELNALKVQHIITALTDINRTTVYFEVKQGPDVTDLTDNKPLKFNNVDINIGGGYDVITGIFTPPIPGVYLFWCHLTVFDSKPINLLLKKNGITSAIGFKPAGVEFGAASFTTVIHVKANDKIYFTQTGSSKLRGGGYSNYGGALLQWMP